MNADRQIKEILSRYDEDFAANTWVVPGGKARAILHKCIERIIAKAGIYFFDPVIVRATDNEAVVLVKGAIDVKEEGSNDTKTITEWSFGEASPKNNKNAYMWSMAEKRGKDRVALKLIGLHGLLYSEEEAEDFKNSAPREAANTVEVVKDDNRTIASTLIAALKKAQSVKDLAEWFAANKDTVENLPENLTDEVRGAYADRLHELRRAA